MLVFIYDAQAQFNWGHNYFEAGLGGGIMNYSGELTNTIFDYKHLHPAGAVFVRYNLGQYLSFRGQFAMGSISGNDKDSPDERNRIRNLDFNSHLFEGSILVDANLMGFHPRGHQSMFSPYVFTGISIFNYEPYTTHFDPNLDNKEIFLRELNTEGQGSSTFTNRPEYMPTQVAIPLGLGIKYAINSNISIGFEIGFRFTFTDYLDDVGQTYPVNALNGEPFYDQNAYLDGAYGNKSAQELFADKTYAYIAEQRGQSLSEYLNLLVPVLSKDPSSITDQAELDLLEQYNSYINARGGTLVRGDKMNDLYMFTMLTVSYNFIENGLVGHRKRRKKKAGCKSAQF